MTTAKPKRPETIKVSPFSIRIEVDPSLVEKHGIVGHWAGDSMRITIDASLDEDAEIDTVLHEVLHAVWSQTFLDRGYTPEQEEEVIWTITPRLIALLRDNPAMVQWIQTCGK